MKIVLVTALSCLSLLYGCAEKQSPPDQQSRLSNTPLTSAEDALNRWLEKRPREYSIVTQRTCFCLPEFVKPVRVIVVNGELVSATFVDNGNTVPLQVFKSLRTVEGWLGHIAELQAKENAEFKAEFNQEYGYPTYFYVDRHERIADDTEELEITRFSVLP